MRGTNYVIGMLSATAHENFKFIDPTWAPGVTSGWLEEGVHEDDAELKQPVNNDNGDDHVEVVCENS